MFWGARSFLVYNYLERLPKKIENILQNIGSIADKMNSASYIAGGFVRDILLGYKNLDIDIVIEGDGIAFAMEFARLFDVRIKVHQRFGTAVIKFPDGFKLDIATARTEYYKYPTALPTVKKSSIKEDLYRRDFTINTLAIKLNSRDYGRLIDFFGGQRDIKEKTIRTLHNLSFIEDPTRVFRAVRFEQRFNFKISGQTQSLIKNTVKMELFHRLSGQRLYNEIVLIFSEREPLKAMKRMAEFSLLRFIHPKLGNNFEPLFRQIEKTINWYNLLFLDQRIENWQIYFMALLDGLKRESILELFLRLTIPDKIAHKFINGIDSSKNILPELCSHNEMEPWDIYVLLHPLPVETILFIMSRTRDEHVKRHISLYLTSLQKEKVSITGKDIKRLGIKPGPIYKEIFEKIIRARLDGKVKTKDDELQYIRDLI